MPSPQAMDCIHRSAKSFKRIQFRHRQGKKYPPKLADLGHWKEQPLSGPIPRVSTGVKDRVNRLKAIGNGQVPQCTALAWKVLSV